MEILRVPENHSFRGFTNSSSIVARIPAPLPALQQATAVTH
jgi:hypothetical protein